MATTRTEKRSRKKKVSPRKFSMSYSLALLFAMLIVGSIAGVMAFSFGKQALEGVNSSPAGVKLPKVSPAPKPKESPSSKPDNKTSFLLDESQVIAEMKVRSQQELGNTTRPSFVIKPSGDRKVMYARVERAYNSMREPLAISASADERIAERIAELRQRVYTSSRSYESNAERLVDRPVAHSVSNSLNTSLPLLSTPVELTPIRSRWEDRDASLLSPKKFTTEDINVVTKPTSGVFPINRQSQTSVIEINRR